MLRTKLCEFVEGAVQQVRPVFTWLTATVRAVGPLFRHLDAGHANVVPSRPGERRLKVGLFQEGLCMGGGDLPCLKGGFRDRHEIFSPKVGKSQNAADCTEFH